MSKMIDCTVHYPKGHGSAVRVPKVGLMEPGAKVNATLPSELYDEYGSGNHILEVSKGHLPAKAAAKVKVKE